jgi:hypothetical protein
MKDFDADKIIESVHAALDGVNVHSIVDNVQKSVAGLDIDLPGETGSGTETIREFQVGVRPELTLGNLHAGNVSVQGHDQQVIRVRATKFGSLKQRDEPPFEATQEGSSLRIRPKGRYSGAPVDYRIEVPRDCTVRIKGINTDVQVEGTRAEVQLETVEGDIQVTDLTGTCGIHTTSGDVAGRRLSGTLNLHTTSGDATIMESQLRRFALHSVSGDFIVETTLAPGEQYLVSTTSGDVRLLVSGSTGATVLMKSFSGEVQSELPTEVIRASKRNWQGRVNGGGAYLEMTSMSGDLRIERGSTYAPGDAAPEPAVPEMPVEEPAPQAEAAAATESETANILAALERGEIDVEEAMTRLEGLGREGDVSDGR